MQRSLCLGVIASVLVGCAVGAAPTEPEAASSKLTHEEYSNLFCDDSLWTTNVGDTFMATTRPSYPDNRSHVAVTWTPSEAGIWEIVVDGADTSDLFVGITLALPICDAARNLASDAYAPFHARDIRSPTVTAATFYIGSNAAERMFIDVFQPPGVELVVSATRIGSVEVPGSVGPCAGATSCGECTSRPNCGWCDATCVLGNADGPDESGCVLWTWLAPRCLAGE